AMVVGERNEARMPSPTCHVGECSRIGAAWQRTGDHVTVDRLIGRPPEATPWGVAEVAYLVRDLLFVSKIAEVAEHLGVAVQGARDADRLVAIARDARLVILDLGQPEALAALERLAGEPATAGVESIGFVGHERLDVMETAKALGCRRVLAKGQLAAELPKLLAQVKRSRDGA